MLVIAVTLVIAWLFRPGWVSNDGAQYLSVAKCLVTGHGISTDIVYYDEHHALGVVPAPQTVFPPGFPALMALGRWLGAPPLWAALGVMLVAYALGAWLLCDVALRLGQRPVIALAVCALWLAFVPHWIDVFLVHSEPAFVALSLASAWLLMRDDAPSALAAGVCAAGAFSVRYAGLFWLMAVAVMFLAELFGQRARRQVMVRALSFGVAPLGMVGWLFWRNHRLVGDFKGGNDVAADRPAREALVTIGRELLSLLGLEKRGLVALAPLELGMVAAVLLLVAALWVYRRDLSLARVAGTRMWWLSGSYVLISVLLLARLEMTTSIGFESRMFVPVVPFVLLLAGDVVGRLRIASSRAGRVLGVALGLVALVYAGGQIQRLRRQLAAPEMYALVEAALGPQRALLEAETSAAHPLLGNEPQLLGGVLDRPVIGLTSDEYSARRFSASEVEALVRRYGVQRVVLMPELLASDAASERPPFFVALAAGAVPPWLTLESEAPGLKIYRVE